MYFFFRSFVFGGMNVFFTYLSFSLKKKKPYKTTKNDSTNFLVCPCNKADLLKIWGYIESIYREFCVYLFCFDAWLSLAGVAVAAHPLTHPIKNNYIETAVYTHISKCGSRRRRSYTGEGSCVRSHSIGASTQWNRRNQSAWNLEKVRAQSKKITPSAILSNEFWLMNPDFVIQLLAHLESSSKCMVDLLKNLEDSGQKGF